MNEKLIETVERHEKEMDEIGITEDYTDLVTLVYIEKLIDDIFDDHVRDILETAVAESQSFLLGIED